jgi:leader peptidase (prepilin peptidase) / N-methyltransferase
VGGHDPLLTSLAGVLGLIFGSFATVVAYRVPKRESVVTGRSKCPSCGRTIGALENIPVVSWIALRGRCRHCGERISVRYPLIELATGLLFALAAWRFGVTVTGVVYAAFFWALVVLTVIDLEHKLLPNRIVYPTFLAGWVGLVVAALVDSELAGARLRSAAFGMLVFGGFLFAVAFVYPAGMGLGDVKLAFALGAFLGYAGGVRLVLMGMFLSFVLGGIIGVVAMQVTGAGRKMQIPFGPFLAGGTVIAVAVGQRLLNVYLDFLG